MIKNVMKYVSFAYGFLIFLIGCSNIELPSRELPLTNGQSISDNKGSPLIKQVIINSHPKWGSFGTDLSNKEVSERFKFVLLDRGNMLNYLPGYQDFGFNGDAFIYFSGYGMAGPEGLGDLVHQNLPCSLEQWRLPVFHNSVTMDAGDFCDIHDSIIFNTSLDAYPDLFPDESWFLHSTNGGRLFHGYGGDGVVYYVMNPASSGVRSYYSRRLLREVVPVELNHPPIPGINGVFIDNLNSTFYLDADVVPFEFDTLEKYNQEKISFLMEIYSYLSSNDVKVMGNLSDMGDPDEWAMFTPYLDVLEAESWVLDWGQGLASPERIESDINVAEEVLASGKKFIGVAQGDRLGTYNQFAFACFLLITDGENAYYKYRNYDGDFSEYYEIPEYTFLLGMPLGEKIKLSNDPITYKRDFECGKVEVDITNGVAEIQYVKCQ